MSEPFVDALPRPSLRLELRTPRGPRLWVLGPHGLVRPGDRGDVGRPDIVLIGEEVALAAVLGGWISPRTAASEGQVELRGEPTAIDRLERLLRAAMAA